MTPNRRTKGRPRRRESQGGGPCPTPATAEPPHQRHRRGRHLAWARSPRWSPLAGRPASAWTSPVVSPSSTRPRGAHITHIRPRRDGQHPEPARERAGRVGRARSRRRARTRSRSPFPASRTPSRCWTRSARRPACTSAPCCASATPKQYPRTRTRWPSSSAASRRSRRARRRPQLTAPNLQGPTEQFAAGVLREQHASRSAVRGLSLDGRRRSRTIPEHGAPARAAGRLRAPWAPVRARPGPDDGAVDRERHGDPEPDRPVGGRLHPGGCRRIGALGQGGPGELPPAARDRARRQRVLGAHHPADPDRFHLVRRPG